MNNDSTIKADRTKLPAYALERRRHKALLRRIAKIVNDPDLKVYAAHRLVREALEAHGYGPELER